MSTTTEPRNPLYLLLLLASLLFVLTALAYAVVPMLEEKAAQAGADVPQSAFRDTLRKEGWKWLLYEVAAMIVLAIGSMWVDRQRLRRLQNDGGAGKMPEQTSDTSSPSTVPHEEPGKADRGTVQTDQLP
jgi:hypothetical protein